MLNEGNETLAPKTKRCAKSSSRASTGASENAVLRSSSTSVERAKAEPHPQRNQGETLGLAAARSARDVHDIIEATHQKTAHSTSRVMHNSYQHETR